VGPQASAGSPGDTGAPTPAVGQEIESGLIHFPSLVPPKSRPFGTRAYGRFHSGLGRAFSALSTWPRFREIKTKVDKFMLRIILIFS
jgi:hypothetical protein